MPRPNPKRRHKPVDPFYVSKRWRATRAKVLARDNHTCVSCGANVRPKGMARVDHILPRRKFPDQAYHLPNLRTLCVACDNARHHADRALHGRKGEVEIGPDGFPVGSDWAS